jgi:hypothetical protein
VKQVSSQSKAQVKNKDTQVVIVEKWAESSKPDLCNRISQEIPNKNENILQSERQRNTILSQKYIKMEYLQRSQLI